MRLVPQALGKALWAATLSLVLLLLPISGAAQAGFGVSGGLSLATLGGSDATSDLSTRTGINVGAFADVPLGGILWLVPGVSYVQKGAQSGLAEVDEVAIDYIELPLLLRVRATSDRTIGLDLLLGPTFAFQVNCELRGPNVNRSCEDEAFQGLDLTKSFDLGAAFGLGASYALSPAMSLLATALWDLGLTSIDDSPSNRDVKNQTILLNLGLAWRLGR